jgi:hypothetical protein
MSNICEIVRKAEDNYLSGETQISEYVSWSLKENVERIEAYKNSKHISGDVDSMNREKPFFNIGIAASNTWYRATDLDRKNIRVKATKESDYIPSLLASIKLRESFRRNNFGIFLNNWGRTLADYGSCISKHVEKDGQLISTVISWTRIIVDPVSFDGAPKIEKLYLTPAQLKANKAYDQDVIKNLLDAKVSRETLSGTKKDSQSDYIEIYEIHGELDKGNLYDGEYEETGEFEQQMHVVSFLQTEDGEYSDYTLYKGKEDKDPYYITHLIEEDGRVMAIGSYERLFEAQWMKNHTAKQIKDYLDIASKLFFQTSDGNFVGQNVLTNLENGDVFIHGVNQPITAVNNYNQAFTAIQSFGQEWEGQANKTAGISEAMMGEQKSGTAWRQTEALLQESHSLFELMTENKGLALEEIIKKYYIPFVKKQLDSKEEITATLSDYGVKEIEKRYIKNRAVEVSNMKNMEQLLNSDPYSVVNPTTPEAEAQTLTQDLQTTGSQRFLKPDEVGIKTWKEIMKDLEWELEIDVTGEQHDTQAVMTTLNTLYMSMVQNPAQAETSKLILSKILEQTGVVSPVEIQAIETAQSQPQMQPQPTQLAPIGGA